MRRTNGRGDIVKDSYIQEPVLGRYYYPPTNQMISPRTGPSNSDNLSSRYSSSKSSYNLLPNKYSLARNNNPYRGGAHDLASPHVLLPGAYEHPYDTTASSGSGYSKLSSSSTNNWHSEFGSLAKVSSKPKPLEPLTSLREKYFESKRINSRSDSQQSTDAEGSESDQEHTVERNTNIRGNVNNSYSKNPSHQLNSNQDARKPPMAPRKNTTTATTTNKSDLIKETRNSSYRSKDEVSVRRQSEMVTRGAQREYQVYHSQVEITNPMTITNAVTSSPGKRMDADSAGSNHTRDSGVSMGSVGSSKTPPSVQNSPKLQHRTPSPAIPKPRSNNVQMSPKTNRNSFEDPAQLHKNWRSTPDVPGAERVPSSEESRRDPSGSSSRNKMQQPIRSPKLVEASASDENMPVHRKPILARRGQSVTRTKDSLKLDVTLPGGSSRESKTRKDSGDYLDDPEENEVPTYLTQSVRNSVSTGNLAHEDGWRSNSISQSKSTHFDIGVDPQRTGRMSSRREGPFGDMRASIDEELSHRNINTVPMKKNGKIVPTKIYKGSFREVNNRKASNGSNRNEVFPADLKPVTSPKHALPMALGQLESTDWETNVEGFRQLVRMIRFDPEAIRVDLHNINVSGVKHLSNLRSQVCRAAILCYKELFTNLGRSMEPDCEKIAEKLLDKSADTNKFIREDSGRALEAMMINLTSAKGLTCLDLFGTRHRNPAVRGMAARLVVKLVDTIGPDRSLTELPERLLPMLCKLLQEGSLDTRTSAKAAMSMLMSHSSFYTQLKRYVPADVLRNSQKNIEALQK